mmetsp:Transcript_11200/g.26386  ORF Transcript_11200/g.26386 Transcript_11200/m.26386 type:complete len:227 (-) Transcript_11200:173-853(-)
MRLRLRLPEGTTTTLELDASTPFNELLREVAKAAGTTPDQVSLKVGMPPTALQLAGTAPISDALQTMETVIVAVCSTTSDQQTPARPGGQLVDDEVSESEGEFADEFDDSPTRRLVKLTQCAMDRDGAASPVIMPRRPTEAPPEQTPEERRAMAKLVLQTLLQREAGDNSTNYGSMSADEMAKGIALMESSFSNDGPYPYEAELAKARDAVRGGASPEEAVEGAFP